MYSIIVMYMYNGEIFPTVQLSHLISTELISCYHNSKRANLENLESENETDLVHCKKFLMIPTWRIWKKSQEKNVRHFQ